MTAPALKVTDLSVRFEDLSGSRQVVDKVSFAIAAGETTGLVGESGCGKTMVSMAIMGLLPETGVHIESGGIEINGTDISGLDQKHKRAILGRDIAMIFQKPGSALDPVFRIGNQIREVHRRHTGSDRRRSTQAMLESLRDVGFGQPEDIASCYPHQLSGGMRQLAMIAMATVCKPSIVIADEPSTALDASSRTMILQQLERLQKAHNMAILLVSHDLSVIRQVCRNVMVMYCGRILESTDCNRLFSRARHPYSGGLLSCVPQVSETRPERVSAIPGQVPVPADLPTGCHFAPRCDRAVAQCRQSPPPLETGKHGSVACFRPL